MRSDNPPNTPSGRPPATVLASLGDHDTCTAQIGQDRLEKAVGDLLGLAQFLGADRRVVGPHRDLDQRPQGIVGFRGNAHGFDFGRNPPQTPIATR